MADFVLTLPIRTVSELNQHEHWRDRLKRSKAQKVVVLFTLRAKSPKLPDYPWEVVLTRVAPRKLDPDNLASSFKWIQDGVASFLGTDDGNSNAVVWIYQQERPDVPNKHEVRVEIKSRR